MHMMGWLETYREVFLRYDVLALLILSTWLYIRVEKETD